MPAGNAQARLVPLLVLLAFVPATTGGDDAAPAPNPIR
jgi:hypothetical protein